MKYSEKFATLNLKMQEGEVQSERESEKGAGVDFCICFILWIFLCFIRESGMWIWIWRDKQQRTGNKDFMCFVLPCSGTSRIDLVSASQTYETGEFIA